MEADLFLLNYNGAEFILDTVKSFREAVRNSRHQCQLFVIDNESTDNSVSLIEQTYCSVPILKMPNRFLCSFNEAAKQSRADIVFLLNNDLIADPYFIDPVLSLFETKEDAFLVASKSFLLDGSYEGGRSIPFFSLGLFGTTAHFPGFEKFIDQPGITFAAGFAGFDRKKFLELGGYDDLYLPGRVEDADIGLRAWKRGWKCYYEPKSVLYHVGGKSFKERFGSRGTMELAHRNVFLFMWKNIESPRFWTEHLIFLIPRMIWMLIRGHYELITALVKAFGRFSEARVRRKKERSLPYRYTDQQVFSFFRNED